MLLPRQGSPVRSIPPSNSDGRRRPPTGNEMDGRLAAVRRLGTRRSEIFNFQRSVSHRRRHLTMRTVAPRYCLEFLFTKQRAPRSFSQKTKPSRVASILPRAQALFEVDFGDHYENTGFKNFVPL